MNFGTIAQTMVLDIGTTIVATPVTRLPARRSRNCATASVSSSKQQRAGAQAGTSSAWSAALLRRGTPKFGDVTRNVVGVCGVRLVLEALVQKERTGNFSDGAITGDPRQRESAMALTCFPQPCDAAAATYVSSNGVAVSKLIGRQSDAAPRSIDATLGSAER